jgi:hypothetical protein
MQVQFDTRCCMQARAPDADPAVLPLPWPVTGLASTEVTRIIWTRLHQRRQASDWLMMLRRGQQHTYGAACADACNGLGCWAATPPNAMLNSAQRLRVPTPRG